MAMETSALPTRERERETIVLTAHIYKMSEEEKKPEEETKEEEEVPKEEEAKKEEDAPKEEESTATFEPVVS